MSEANFEAAIRLHEAGQLAEAARLFSDIVRANPRHFESVYRLGAIHFQSGHFAEAEHLFAAANRIDPRVPEAFYSRACALQNLLRHEDALTAFARALALKPDYIEARNNRGASLLALGRYDEALSAFDKVVAVQPNNAIGHGNRASALSRLKRFTEALAACEQALRRNPSEPSFWYYRGEALFGLARFEEAGRAFDKALSLRADYPEALEFRGLVAAQIGRHEEALAFYDRALQFTPESANLLNYRCNALLNLRRYEDAIPECEDVLRLDPDYVFVRGNLLHARLHVCDWRVLERERAEVTARLQSGALVLQPLQNLLISRSEADGLQCAKLWVANQCPPSPAIWRGERYRHDKIRIAYISANLREHAVAYVMAGVFEQHDHERFETTAIALGRADLSKMHARLKPAFTRFIEAGDRSDTEIAAHLRALEIDIAVDLMGFTDGARPGILAARPAPIAVNYLGYPGTMGAPYIDYILADAIVAPLASQGHYAEKLVHLPGCYLPADPARRIATAPSRSGAGLPDEGFVFCSFNTPAKFNPETFDIWMRLLGAVDGSVLWLSSLGPAALRNLRREAEARGIRGDRIIAAPFVDDASEHLARLSLADLFLDTLPYNAHAGGTDALLAGVPIVTCMGATFAGRVGASLVTAAGLPELAAPSLAEYERLALDLARDKARLSDLRATLGGNRDTQPLFDIARHTRHLEAAYTQMWERAQRGEAPANFAATGPAA